MTSVESMVTCCFGTVLGQTLSAGVLESLLVHLNFDTCLIPRRMVGETWCLFVSVWL